MDSKTPYVYSGFQRYEAAEAFAKTVNAKGGKAEVITRESGDSHEIVVISWE